MEARSTSRTGIVAAHGGADSAVGTTTAGTPGARGTDRSGPSPVHETLTPDAGRMIRALRSMGYTFEQAAADVVDNSVAAGSRHVLIRLMLSGSSITRVVFADDGRGMSDARIAEAMRFGSKRDSDGRSLGKFGMGLKLASLSHSPSLTVVSVQGGRVCGRRWTEKGIAEGWQCEVLQAAESSSIVGSVSDALELGRHGTVVVWDRPDRLVVGGEDLAGVVHRLTRRLVRHLGLYLHRFIEDGRVGIEIDSQQTGAALSPARTRVVALNPFGYDETATEGYPRAFRASIPGVGDLRLEAHIWPRLSACENYKLDGATSRQGLYFYRNDRLIQAGGWNGLRDVEPHLSLARVAVDLPEAFDDHFSLDVQKSSIEVPPTFVTAVRSSVDSEGKRFATFLSRSQSLYRQRERTNPDNHPLVPGAGVSAPLRAAVRDILVPERRTTRTVTFVWARLGVDQVFELDREHRRIQLNRLWRPTILCGRRASVADAPLVKMLVFLLVKEDLDADRVSRRKRERLEQINKVLLAALTAQDRGHDHDD